MPEALVTLYADENHGGGAIGLFEARFYDDADLRGLGNDCVSSFIVASGYAVTLYEDARFRGNCQRLLPRSYAVEQLALVGNDTISSVRLPAGWQVTSYEHHFDGRRRVITDDAPTLDGFNDIMSSVLVRDTVAVGRSELKEGEWLTPGDFLVADGDAANVVLEATGAPVALAGSDPNGGAANSDAEERVGEEQHRAGSAKRSCAARVWTTGANVTLWEYPSRTETTRKWDGLPDC